MDKPSFLGGSGDGAQRPPEPTRIPAGDPAGYGQEAPAGKTFGADNPVENTPFPGSMSRG